MSTTIGNGFSSIAQITDTYLNTQKTGNTHPSPGQASFRDILNRTLEETSGEVHFSKHASQRLLQREIELTPEQNSRLANGVAKAGEKGIKDSLVLMDSLAFIVNVPSNTVITAMDSEESKEKAFTNIDGAVIV